MDLVETTTVTDILRRAAEAVVAADLPENLRNTAFGKAVDLLTQGPPAGSQVRSAFGSETSRGTDDPLQAIGAKLGLERSLIDEVFEVENGNVNLTIARSKLEPKKAAGTKQIALLLAAARQGAGIEDWTEGRTIRAVASDYGKFDGPNFASSISELGDYFSFSGSGSGRRLKMRRAGFEEAASVIKKLNATK